jgi:hypothetical protein
LEERAVGIYSRTLVQKLPGNFYGVDDDDVLSEYTRVHDITMFFSLVSICKPRPRNVYVKSIAHEWKQTGAQWKWQETRILAH